MIDFNIDLNPNKVDMETYNPDQDAMKHMELVSHISSTPLKGFPEGFDIEVGEVVELNIPETGYSSSSCKIYYPKGEGPFPVLFCIHGGAFMGGWQFLDEPFCRQISRDCKVAVVSPKYVLAPEFKFPRPIIEMYRELLYLKKEQKNLRLDMSRLAVAGGSAGGHHALNICQLAYERREIEHLDIKYGVFAYPVLDGHTPGKERVDNLTDTAAMPPEMIDVFIDTYYPEGLDRKDPYFSPLNMNLEALPPFLMFSGRVDTLNQEFRQFAARVLEEGKNEAIFKIYPGTHHGFLESDAAVEAARDIKSIACDLLKRALY